MMILVKKSVKCSLGVLLATVAWSCESELTQSPAYRVDVSFPKLPANQPMGQASGVAVNSKGEVWVYHREERPFLVFDAKGNFLRAIGTDKKKGAHGLRFDTDDNLWITDYLNHTVKKLDQTGTVLLSLGQEGIAGDDSAHFNQPTDVAFAANGDFYISDGYGNARVVQYNRQGKFIRQWGTHGSSPGQFNLPHAVQVDSKGNVYVADRENFRIQVFTSNGQFIRQLTGYSPYGMFVTKDDLLFVVDGKANRLYKMTLTGEQLASWGGGPGDDITKELGKNFVLRLKQGAFSMPHAISVGPDGAVYVAEINGQRVQKFMPE
ncbi:MULTISPECIES: peptidyl-alpha-hydroxyglycine alpha-amidating lyase family protein [unclassified Spirosoma]|uniref:peptidyl-alpha-hydroxyglycine alpha-amidating lyase family protein n=1 Tax=unclassified Spirosoma TaxID=2621999 RepID=UPI001ACE1162|nr:MULTISPECIES: peptidyl-alpha-hydroxyglycine alpha-amidating lyase family protein [unclassified Spirosoma]MBN8826533.1 hypothetical protein [Spirosoma sp.]